MVQAGIILFCLGAISGSFLNVVILRYRENKFLFGWHLGGRSRCLACLQQLAWYELIPIISFLWLRGRCRSCGKSLTRQYLFVELASALVFLLPLYFYEYFNIAQQQLLGNLLVWYYWLSIAWVIAGLLMIILAVIDFRTYIIPDETVIGIAAIGLFVMALKAYYQEFIGWQSSFMGNYAMMTDLSLGILGNHLLAAAIGFVFFGIIFAASKGRGMGFGDVKLAGALGLLLGWPDSVLAFGLAFIIGSIVGLFLIITSQRKFREPVPFGPYLIVGVAVTILFGHYLVELYLKLFGIV